MENASASASASSTPAAAAADSPWDQPGLGCAALLLLPIAAVGFLLNALSVTELVTERASCTRHYASMASLAACDAIDSLCCVPLAVAKSYTDDLTTSQQLGHAWYCLEVTFRTVALLHLTASSLDLYLHLNGIVWILSAQKRRQVFLTLVVCWTISLVLTLPPHFWYHFAAAAGNPVSRLRKLVVCVFVLSFVFPLAAQLVAYGLLLRSWQTAKRQFAKYEEQERSRDRPSSLSPNGRKRSLVRTESGFGRRGSHRRQPSFKGGKSLKHQTGGRSSSPQLDRHPSLRYSIKRRKSGASVAAMDAAAPTTIAGAAAPEQDRGFPDPSVIERRLVEVAAAAAEWRGETDQETSAFLPVLHDQFLAETSLAVAGGESKRSSRSSKSDRGSSDSPKIDRHPSLRFSTRRKPPAASVPDHGTRKPNSARNSLVPAAVAADPYLLLSGLQVSHKKLSAQVSFPDTCLSWQEEAEEERRDPSCAPRRARHSSGEELLGALRNAKRRGGGGGGGSVKRCAANNRKEVRRSQTSPKLDRHPSLRFSTKRKPTDGAGRKRTAGSNLSIQVQDSLQLGSEFCQRQTTGSALSMSRYPDNAPPPQPSPSPRGSNVSIGTCHDLQVNLGFYSVKNKGATTNTKPSDSPHQPEEEEHDDNTQSVNCHRQRNLLRVVAVSDRDIAGADTAALVAPDAGRRRSAEGPVPSIHRRSSSRRNRFNRDTNHAVEDWLSLESSRHPNVVKRHQHHQQTTSLLPAENDVTRQTTDESSRRRRRSREQTSPVPCFRRSAEDLRMLSATVWATVFLALPWTMAALVLGLRAQIGETARPAAPSMLFLFLLQSVSSLGVVARPVIYHVTHGGFRRAFWNLRDRLMLNRFR